MIDIGVHASQHPAHLLPVELKERLHEDGAIELVLSSELIYIVFAAQPGPFRTVIEIYKAFGQGRHGAFGYALLSNRLVQHALSR